MRTEPQPQEVRALVTRVFKELGTPVSAQDGLHETIVQRGQMHFKIPSDRATLCEVAN